MMALRNENDAHILFFRYIEICFSFFFFKQFGENQKRILRVRTTGRETLV